MEPGIIGQFGGRSIDGITSTQTIDPITGHLSHRMPLRRLICLKLTFGATSCFLRASAPCGCRTRGRLLRPSLRVLAGRLCESGGDTNDEFAMNGGTPRREIRFRVRNRGPVCQFVSGSTPSVPVDFFFHLFDYSSFLQIFLQIDKSTS